MNEEESKEMKEGKKRREAGSNMVNWVAVNIKTPLA